MIVMLLVTMRTFSAGLAIAEGLRWDIGSVGASRLHGGKYLFEHAHHCRHLLVVLLLQHVSNFSND